MALQSHRTGFTLVELSMVLVIIALVVGGVVAGRELIKAAGYRKLVSEPRQLEVAINTFRLKYNALPGDMANATQIWGTDPAGCNDPTGSIVPLVETCNGNGDGTISSAAPENLRIWQHIANAGLMHGQYSGKPAGSYYTCTGGVGQNIPRTNAPGFGGHAGWCWYSWNTVGWNGSGNFTGKFYGPLVMLGDGLVDTGSFVPVFSPADAYILDNKFDDGRIGMGDIHAFPEAGGGMCATGWSHDTAGYVPNVSNKYCIMMFDIGISR